MFAPSFFTSAAAGREVPRSEQIGQSHHACARLERVHVHGDGRRAVFERVILFNGFMGQLAFLRTGTNPARNFTAAAAAKINPRASIPTTASTEPGLNLSVSKSIAPENNRASASTA